MGRLVVFWAWCARAEAVVGDVLVGTPRMRMRPEMGRPNRLLGPDADHLESILWATLSSICCMAPQGDVCVALIAWWRERPSLKGTRHLP